MNKIFSKEFKVMNRLFKKKFGIVNIVFLNISSPIIYFFKGEGEYIFFDIQKNRIYNNSNIDENEFILFLYKYLDFLSFNFLSNEKKFLFQYINLNLLIKINKLNINLYEKFSTFYIKKNNIILKSLNEINNFCLKELKKSKLLVLHIDKFSHLRCIHTCYVLDNKKVYIGIFNTKIEIFDILSNYFFINTLGNLNLPKFLGIKELKFGKISLYFLIYEYVKSSISPNDVTFLYLKELFKINSFYNETILIEKKDFIIYLERIFGIKFSLGNLGSNNIKLNFCFSIKDISDKHYIFSNDKIFLLDFKSLDFIPCIIDFLIKFLYLYFSNKDDDSINNIIKKLFNLYLNNNINLVFEFNKFTFDELVYIFNGLSLIEYKFVLNYHPNIKYNYFVKKRENLKNFFR